MRCALIEVTKHQNRSIQITKPTSAAFSVRDAVACPCGGGDGSGDGGAAFALAVGGVLSHNPSHMGTEPTPWCIVPH